MKLSSMWSILTRQFCSKIKPVTTEGRQLCYTVPNGNFTIEQRQFYEDNGFLLIKNAVDLNVLDECAAHFKDLCEGRADKGTMTMMKDVSLKDTNAKGEYLYYKVQDIVWDEIFSKFLTLPKLLDYIECFVGPNVSAMHTMLINKPPDSGKMTSIHPLHQDLHYFPFRPVDRIVAAWTAMEHVDEQNGCLVVIPGTHKGQLLQHDYPEWEGGVNKAFHGIRGFDLVPTVKLVMEKGDTALFHPLLIHGSGPNMSKGFRKAISGHYSTTDYHHIDVRGTSQANIAAEIEEMAKRKGLPISFGELWDYRSRVVRGRPKTTV